MEQNWLARTEVLIGPERIEKLAQARVLIVGLGGVGSFAAEYIARAGIGHMTIVDGDVVEATNRNRQLPALQSTEGQPKTTVMAQRLRDIRADLDLHVLDAYMVDEKLQALLDERPFDYVMDCIDTITPKIMLIRRAVERGIPVVSSMGAGGKLDPMQVRVADLSQSYNCTLAQALRKRLKRAGIVEGVKAVFSTEVPDKSRLQLVHGSRHKKSYLGTISYMPSLFGAFCASVVIRDLAGLEVTDGRNPRAELRKPTTGRPKTAPAP